MRPGLLVTVARHVPPAAGDLRRVLESREGTLSRGPSHVAWHLLDAVIAGYDQVLHDLRGDVQVLEREAFTNPSAPALSQRIYLLKREALDFRQAAAGLLEPLGELAEGHHGIDGDDGLPDWAGLEERVERLVDRSAAISDLLTGVLSAYQTDVALRQNEDMRKISAWVAIAAVPTLLAGIYGMNFEHMPELRSPLGYPGVLLAMLVICTSLYVLFRRKHWL
jgi:magnesium transporter